MSEMKKKIGQQGLNGLLNVKSAPEPDVGFDDDYPYSSGGYGDGYGQPYRRNYESDRRGYEPVRSSGMRTTISSPICKEGARGGRVAFYEEDGLAVVSAREMTRIKLELAETVRRAMDVRGMSLSFAGDSELCELLGVILETGCRVKPNNSVRGMLRIMVEEDAE